MRPTPRKHQMITLHLPTQIRIITKTRNRSLFINPPHPNTHTPRHPPGPLCGRHVLLYVQLQVSSGNVKIITRGGVGSYELPEIFGCSVAGAE
ncbi:hypothetical protein Hanom_Chr10g00910181 [Helianthus anomalus]